MRKLTNKFPLRKVLALFLTLIICFGGISFSDLNATTVQAATASGKWGKNITWKFKNGTLTISGKGKMQDTPRRFESGRWIYTTLCYEYKTKITKVVIKEGITAIGAYNFFYFYPNIRSVTLPNSLKSIGDRAFDVSSTPDHPEIKSNLKTINFPRNLKTIGEYAFDHCDKLTSTIDLSSNIKSIGYGAFLRCTKVPAIKIRNKNCKIDGYYTLPENAVVYGYKGSTAEQYTKLYVPNGPAHAHIFRTLKK